jgi:hypothetical protein
MEAIVRKYLPRHIYHQISYQYIYQELTRIKFLLDHQGNTGRAMNAGNRTHRESVDRALNALLITVNKNRNDE